MSLQSPSGVAPLPAARETPVEALAPGPLSGEPGALLLTGVTKRFGAFVAVDRLDLSVAPGQVLGFLGPNGAGKTTTLRMVMSIIYPDEGSIRVLGHSNARDVKDRIGYLPEERGLYRKMTVDQTLRYFGQLKGLGGKSLGARAGELLERVGLAAWRDKTVESLSKGMQQKLQFITTLLHDPELVVLDEPFSGLDPLNRDLLEDLVVDLRTRGRTVIFSTHLMEQAERMCDRIVLINRGRKLIEGTVHEVRSRFATRMVVIEGEGDFFSLASHPAVAHAQVTAGTARLELRAGAESEAILRTALELGRIRRFELQSPDLQEIFVRLIEQDAAERGIPPADAHAVSAPGGQHA